MARNFSGEVRKVKLLLSVKNRRFFVDTFHPHDISIPWRFEGEAPTSFGAAVPKVVTYEAGGFIGDTRRGGSCNVKTITFTPHTNGTHTESVQHIVNDFIPVGDALQDSLVPATLITVTPERKSATRDSYDPKFADDDSLVTRKILEEAISKTDSDFLDALIIRSLPNDASKMSRDYDGSAMPPYLSIEAMEWLNEKSVKHLLVDFPSVDRLDDDGAMVIHRLFWGIPRGSRDAKASSLLEKTITEFIFVPDDVKDGPYLLNLQIPHFETDAAPSRPLLYSLSEVKGA